MPKLVRRVRIVDREHGSTDTSEPVSEGIVTWGDGDVKRGREKAPGVGDRGLFGGVLLEY